MAAFPAVVAVVAAVAAGKPEQHGFVLQVKKSQDFGKARMIADVIQVGIVFQPLAVQVADLQVAVLQAID